MAVIIREVRRREVFKALVDSQDGGLGVEESRKKVATDQGVREKDVVAIEK